MDIEAFSWLEELPNYLDTKQNQIAFRILKGNKTSIKVLLEVGLGYLHLQ